MVQDQPHGFCLGFLVISLCLHTPILSQVTECASNPGRFIRVYRERADLGDFLKSEETSYYVTSVPADGAGAERLGSHIRSHWEIENKVHWVRDWAFDEDRHQLRRSSSVAQVFATLRNLAIGILRLAGATNITATLRWIARDATRAACLIGC